MVYPSPLFVTAGMSDDLIGYSSEQKDHSPINRAATCIVVEHYVVVCIFSGLNIMTKLWSEDLKVWPLAEFFTAPCTKLQSVRVALTYNVNLSMDEIIDADSSTYYEAKVALELLIVTLSCDPD